MVKKNRPTAAFCAKMTHTRIKMSSPGQAMANKAIFEGISDL
jgi:hypothetical protein